MIIKKIYDALISAGYSERFARFVVAQSAHETGGWKSAIFRLNHNLFGMKLPKKRKTTAIGEKQGHAIYRSIEQSIEDFILYLRSQGYPLDCVSVGEYCNILVKKGYFEAPVSEYLEGLERNYKKYFEA